MALVGSEQSYTKTFFVVSQLFLLLSLWSLVDEFFIRRPWKDYQSRFNALEMQLARRDLLAAEKAFVTGSPSPRDKVKQLQKQIEDITRAKEKKLDSKAGPDIPKPCQGKTLEKCVYLLQNNYDDLVLTIKFNKSKLDSLYYLWKHSLQQGHEDRDGKEKYLKLESVIKVGEAKRKTALVELDGVKQRLGDFDNNIADAKKQIEVLKDALEQAKKKIETIQFRPVEIKQVVIDDFGKQGNIYWGRVDRCQTCHVAIDKPGYEDVTKALGLTIVAKQQDKDGRPEDEQALAKRIREMIKADPAKKGFLISAAEQHHLQLMYGTHPKQKELLGRHPVETFGCTACHGGDGRGLRIQGEAFGEGDKVHAFHHHAVEPMLKGDQMESNCLSCHNGMIQLKDAPHLSQGAEVFVEMGCQGCHLVKGYDGLHKVGPDLNKVGSKVKTEWLVDWLKDPQRTMPNARMPNFNFEDKDVVAVASYLVAQSSPHSLKNQTDLGGDINNGKKLFGSVGCNGCHSADFEDTKSRQRAPNLSRITAKVKSSQWVYDWLKDPKNYSQHARMPSLRLSDTEASDITAYLMSQGKDHPQVIRQRSGALVAQVDAKNQQLTLQGKKIMGERGCYACHEVKGFEGFERIGPELTKEALKEPFELDYGDALGDGFVFTDVTGKQVLVTHREEEPAVKTAHVGQMKELPNGVDTVANLEETWQSWIRNKILYPMHIYKHERAVLKMPTFKLFDHEVDALMVFIKGLTGRTIAYAYNAGNSPFFEDVVAGQRLMSARNCLACHVTLDFTGDITAGNNKFLIPDINPYIEAYVKDHIQTPLETKRYFPPSLSAVGEKIRPEWLMRFLKDPTPYRPNVFVRMPTFGFDEPQLNVLAKYFAGVSHRKLDYTATDYVLGAEDVKNGGEMTTKSYDCFSCHIVNGQAPGYQRTPDKSAPDLALAKDRLQFDFIPKWIQNSAAYQRFSAMPPFIDTKDNADPAFYQGDVQKQLQAVRAYILSTAGGVTTAPAVLKPE